MQLAQQSEPLAQPELLTLPGMADVGAPRYAGIHAIEVYTPRHAVDARALEASHGVPHTGSDVTKKKLLQKLQDLGESFGVVQNY